jgi:DNA-binding LacI/PurR family transcriptional regulator
MVSINDVAKRAGCSATLVSRVVNNQYGVSEKSRKKIQQAIAELGYNPNGLARSLVLKKTHAIGVVVDTLCDAYFFDLFHAIDEEVGKHDYNVLYCSGENDPERKNKYITYLMQGRVDGIIIYGSKLDDSKLIDRLISTGFPFALIEHDIGERNANNIVLNNIYGSKLAVDHLFNCGCSRITYVDGDSENQASCRRLEGFIQAMQAHGIARDKLDILSSGWTEEAGYQTINTFLMNGGVDNLPDAFYFSADQTAFGGLKALQKYNIRVPEDVMIVGYDDDRPRSYDFNYIPLTTIHQPLDVMGKQAVRVLLDDINEKKEQKEKMMYYPSLVIRNTTMIKK